MVGESGGRQALGARRSIDNEWPCGEMFDR